MTEITIAGDSLLAGIVERDGLQRDPPPPLSAKATAEMGFVAPKGAGLCLARSRSLGAAGGPGWQRSMTGKSPSRLPEVPQGDCSNKGW